MVSGELRPGLSALKVKRTVNIFWQWRIGFCVFSILAIVSMHTYIIIIIYSNHEEFDNHVMSLAVSVKF